MNGKVGSYLFRLAVALLTLGIFVIGTFLVVVAVPDLTRDPATITPPPPTPTPTPSPRSSMALSPLGIEMPADANCNGCHLTASGGIGTKPIPVMGHPLAGWRDCTACHAEARLVRTAEGHSTLHKEECLICHQTRLEAGATAGPGLRPEHMGGSQRCSSCHGVDEHAPLPESMANRGDNCWICHNGPEFVYLFQREGQPLATPPATPSAPAPDAEASQEPSSG